MMMNNGVRSDTTDTERIVLNMDKMFILPLGASICYIVLLKIATKLAERKLILSEMLEMSFNMISIMVLGFVYSYNSNNKVIEVFCVIGVLASVANIICNLICYYNTIPHRYASTHFSNITNANKVLLTLTAYDTDEVIIVNATKIKSVVPYTNYTEICVESSECDKKYYVKESVSDIKNAINEANGLQIMEK